MWGSTNAQLIVNLCSCGGMSLCYLLSATLAKPLVERYFAARLAQLRGQLAAWRGDTGSGASTMGTFFVIFFLRMTPLAPNWFVSLSAPVVGFPYPVFLAASLAGIIPANYVHCSTGRILTELALAGGGDSDSASATAASPDMSPYVVLFALQFVALVPVLLQGRLARAAQPAGEPDAQQQGRPLIQPGGGVLQQPEGGAPPGAAPQGTAPGAPPAAADAGSAALDKLPLVREPRRQSAQEATGVPRRRSRSRSSRVGHPPATASASPARRAPRRRAASRAAL